LSARRTETNPGQIRVALDFRFRRVSRHHVSQPVLQSRAARHDDPERDGAVGVQAFEILEIAVEERIFVVPFDLERDHAFIIFGHMIDFVGNGFAPHAVDRSHDFEFMLAPPFFDEGASKPLRRFGFAPARTDDLLYRYRHVREHGVEVAGDVGKIEP
jgi:hypothetical protein